MKTSSSRTDSPQVKTTVDRTAGVARASVGVFIEDVEAASVQSITQRKAYGRSDATDDGVVSYVVAG